ncbi:MAG: hypothetical protein IKN86_07555 [Bacteroidaceae bacterium]|nr:hypothetical protein [Bacteroidaceae bacterium]
MKTYIKPETIVADMFQETTILTGSPGVTSGKKLGDEVVGEGGVFYSKEDNGWDDFEE